MSNCLRTEEIARIRSLFADGRSLRAVAREMGISINTARRYQPLEKAFCPCGQLAGHRGWCKARYAESVARQAFHAKRRGIQVDWTPAPAAKSRAAKGAEEKRKWLGIGEDWKCDVIPPPSHCHYGIIGFVRHATRRIRAELREDVTSAMIVAALEGRLPPEDIDRAVPTFIGYEIRCGIGSSYRLRSMDEPFGDDNSGTIGEAYGAAEWWQNAFS